MFVRRRLISEAREGRQGIHPTYVAVDPKFSIHQRNKSFLQKANGSDKGCMRKSYIVTHADAKSQSSATVLPSC